uniref:Uncharacterized protein n=1 Tax=Trichogramma kaykai TaxID=54128 RepID=A0ABD2XM14_9HYME
MPKVIGSLDPRGDNTINWIINASLQLLLKYKVCISSTFNVGVDDRIIRFRWKLCKGSTLDECYDPPEYKDVWRLILCCIHENSSITWNYKISFFKNDKMLHTRIHNCTFSAAHREELIFIVFSDKIDQNRSISFN